MDNQVVQPPIINPPTEVVPGSIKGIVKDIDGTAVAEAEVSFNTFSTLTNEMGEFYFTNIDLFEDGTLINVSKSGYFNGSRKFFALSNETNNIEIELIEREVNGSASTIDGGRVIMQDAYIELPPGQYTHDNGQIYSGDIHVYGRWLDPSDDQMYFQMPGDLTGRTIDGEIMSLSSFGIVMIEVTDDLGNLLVLPDDRSATVNFPIPHTLKDDAPSTIALWHYDENNGIWIEEGSAELVDDQYSAQVEHISHWACHVPFDELSLNGSVILNGEMFPNTKIRISDDSYFTAINKTTLNGEFFFKVPVGADLNIEVIHECGSAVLSKSVGSFQTDSELEAITISPSGDNIHLSGVVKTCEGQNASNSLVRIDMGAQQLMIRSDQQGQFNYSHYSCTLEDLEFYAIDLENEMMSEELSLPVRFNMSAGNISACQEVAAGFDINYPNMDWAVELRDKVQHCWTISTIQAATNKIIINPVMKDPATGETYFSAAFVFEEGSDTASYVADFNSQGFTITDKCNLEVVDYGDFKSYRFIGISNNVNFDLVYYD